MGWAGYGIAALALDQAPADTYRAQAVLALGITLLGARMFWRSGGNQITATGLYGLGMTVFSGLAGLYWSANPEAVAYGDGLYLATLAGYWVTLAIYAFGWLLPPIEYPQPTHAAADVTRWGLGLGVVVTGVGVWAMRQFGPAAAQVALAGLSVVVGSLVIHRFKARRTTLRLLIAALIAAASAVLIFSAFGRLMLVALGLVAAVTLSGRLPTRRVKALTLAGVPPAAVALIRFRENAQVQLGYKGDDVDGLGSAVSPIATLGRLIEGDVSHAGAESFLASALFWIPRANWPEKPLGLGSAITAELEPELLGVGHSMAAQGIGEWFFNFGWLGVVVMVPIMAAILHLLDRGLARAIGCPVESKRRLLWVFAITVLVAEVPVLAWSGSFTYTTRAGSKFALLVLLLVIFGARGPRNELEAARGRRGSSTTATVHRPAGRR